MINCILVDDEKSARDSLSFLLQENCPHVKILAQCKSAAEGITTIKQLKPDLVFLDVEMPNGTGFEMLQQFSEINFEVIFATGFDKYALKAFKFSALDYLMKPVVADELVNAVSRFENKKNKTDSNIQLNLLLSNLKNIKTGIHKIAVPAADGLSLLDVKEIVHLEADGNYTVFFTINGKHTVSKSLGEYEELLSENNFLRVHQSHLINLDHVKKYIRGEGGYVVMDDGTSVNVSVRKKSEVLERLSHF
ncbi:MAG: LytTR family DNA-binding domain-containing protein [Bacteroidia bacterium]